MAVRVGPAGRDREIVGDRNHLRQRTNSGARRGRDSRLAKARAAKHSRPWNTVGPDRIGHAVVGRKRVRSDDRAVFERIASDSGTATP